MDIDNMSLETIKEYVKEKEEKEKDNKKVVIQQRGYGNVGIEILGKNYYSNILSTSTIRIIGNTFSKKHTVYIHTSLPSLKEAIKQYEEMYGEVE